MSYATNIKEHGGNFFDIVNDSFKKANDVAIATGYIGKETIEDFRDQFIRIANAGGVSKILVGMAHYEGLKDGQIDVLMELNEELCNTGTDNGVFISINGRYHGKIYSFNMDETKYYYVGSSNFSTNGLRSNKELTILIDGENNKQNIQSYIDYLFDIKNAANIKNVKNLSKDKKKSINTKSRDTIMSSLNRYEPSLIARDDLDFAFSFPLEKSARLPRSDLNTYFAKGRLSSRTGVVTPRPWYEVELISPATIINQDGYVRGNFTAYTDDGFIIPMKTSGANNKNIQARGSSRGTLQIFGAWIKGKMEQKGALKILQTFDMEVLDSYGVKELKFYKIKNENFPEDSFYLEF